MLKTSTEIRSVASHIGEERAVEAVAKAGFDAWDFSMLAMVRYDWGANRCSPCNHPLAGNDCFKFARRLKQIGLDNGIVCNQSHAPYPTYCPEIRATYERCIELTAEAGGDVCVIHPDNFKTAEENAEMYLELLPLAKQCGVKIAAENMWTWSDKTRSASSAACSNPKSFLEHMNSVNDEFLVACLDIGHAELKGLDTSAEAMITSLGKHLQALHIHDNDKLNDSHQIPFSMDIDFVPVAKALKAIDYSGYLTLEACSYLRDFDSETLLKGVKDLADSARKFAEMIETV